ncbi:hypothetical protein RIF23_10590 [Lipingzhangella sp. LS1_29]|uniref:DUF6879 domain-containing protein n=1 Tax=Lipingzhangella rawalii TaxID=2055835 RepID=A0ABU2H618_9ACTN|nr:DUF6879 family protein [Lipingzhangella rawalii]MDS1270747.1 hypothetical protein [Lipingzhangella rawalii]
MPDRAMLVLPDEQGVRLELGEYRRDFAERQGRIRNRSSWKFERQQHFKQPGDPSWEAFREGRWDEALRLLEQERPEFEQEAQEDAARAHWFHRVRIVAEPLTPYVQWELHSLWIQAECGERIRVVPDAAVRHLEGDTQLPEVVVLGGETLYQVCYTEAGALDGGIRFTHPELVGNWERFIAELYATGEDMRAYAERYLAHLPPPQSQSR